MKRTIYAFIALVFIFSMLVGCSGHLIKGDKKSPTMKDLTALLGEEPIKAVAEGTENVTVNARDLVAIMLPEDVSTGYYWSGTMPAGMLKVTETLWFGKEQAVRDVGYRVFAVKAAKQGTFTIAFKLTSDDGKTLDHEYKLTMTAE